MESDRLSVYRKLALEKVPLILSLQDREEMSPTYGCLDRTYWQWKFTDFPGARFQEALLLLSYVYSTKFDGNIYHGNKKVLKWIEAGYIFWANMQHGDGSFDEAYPYERSFVAAGFGLFYLTEAYFLIKDSIADDIRDRILATFGKAGDWLIKNDEQHAFISNHRLGASAGLFNLSQILTEKKYEERCWMLWESVKKNQSKDGWYSEYGGADPGYLTQGIYYAAVLYKRSKKEDIRISLEKALNFIQYFVHPDGTIGGEYGSRNTEFYFPGGFEILAAHNPVAESISRRLLASVIENKVPCINSTDVHNMIPIANSIVSASQFYSLGRESSLLPYASADNFVKYFEDFKILVKKKDRLYAVVGISKGGVLKAYDAAKGELIKSNVGIFGRLGNKVITSQSFHKDGLKANIDGDIITIEGDIVTVNHSLLTPPRMIVFRTISLILKIWPAGSAYLKKIIVNALISKRKNIGRRFRRTIVLRSADQVEVTNEVEGVPLNIFREMELQGSYHMGSSKYYKVSDLT